ncbi:hypothetical protein E2C01_041943 [Portunus trituberculatus]|uniref:Uncharacterized protein n=1 Tax=Portunus trituberculatus TaxID=210409 RepID=A0A5B7FS15_PORTR|nr:hypothetical protein [Portunus trituberculatus]
MIITCNLSTTTITAITSPNYHSPVVTGNIIHTALITGVPPHPSTLQWRPSLLTCSLLPVNGVSQVSTLSLLYYIEYKGRFRRTRQPDQSVKGFTMSCRQHEYRVPLSRLQQRATHSPRPSSKTAIHI